MASAEGVVRFRVNGAPTEMEATAEPLLFVLRNRLGLQATHFGCGQEQCGSCMVAIDGMARHSCTLSADALEGVNVTTAEALPDDPVGRALVAAFLEEQAGQCGYCLPGMLMSAFCLLKREPAPDRAAIVAALDGHLCRCGAHGGILRAIEKAARQLAVVA
jgi:nicotinate dehydrogenase subunit A